MTLVALGVAVVVLAWLQPGAYEPSADDAAKACSDKVRTMLKSPGGAHFMSESARPLGDDQWLVTGNVDSQNSFGAQLRSAYGCTATYDEGEWTTSNVGIAP